MTPKPNPNVVAIPEPLADETALAYCVKALKQSVDSLGGRRGSTLDRAVTFRDLFDMGLVTASFVGSGAGGATGTVTRIDTGTGLHGGPITTTGMIELADTPVVPGVYLSANITVDQQGRIVSAGNGAGASGGGIPEAPLDGVSYGRQNANWVHVIAATNDVVDGGNF